MYHYVAILMNSMDEIKTVGVFADSLRYASIYASREVGDDDYVVIKLTRTFDSKTTKRI